MKRDGRDCAQGVLLISYRDMPELAIACRTITRERFAAGSPPCALEIYASVTVGGLAPA